MTLEEKINQAIKEAMLARAKERLEALRSVKSGIILLKTDKGPSHEVTVDEELKMLQKQVKQRKESAEIYTQQNRPELAEKELAEAKIIEEFLPAQMSAEELESKIKAIIAQVGAQSAKDMGKVMGVASKELTGKAEGRAISDMVKRLLA
ncbi:GatB/YqeY domain-containing protein [Williamwhitmania taraxaci]|uniref:Glutamyl-tRNA amidotransferase n=1 Tax=Williamwhitmania taraxaci TaxID=1640674 RepID=A0A1G6L5W1_9BACT|nr:GatB/YqeY domain-containing protein [Williamwhitmania taraxaci]SDC38692.1 hypothetical protein SAMN05216323_102914 [Williamwhitmania taraxaci]